MQAHAADECRANALRCVEVAQHAHTLDDRSDFLAFADAWYKLANEIDYSDRLIALIDALGASEPVKESTSPEGLGSGIRSLRRLAAALVTISTRFMADQLSEKTLEGDL
jgi:hypothetical protein